MGGGGGGSHITEYEPTRVGVDKRRYGELSKTGIQSIDQYKQYSKSTKGRGKTQADFMNRVNVMESYNTTDKEGNTITKQRQKIGNNGQPLYKMVNDTAAYGKYTKGLGGATYDAKWNRWKTSTGVDMEAALNDWSNYAGERTEIAEYGAKETRRKEAPDELTGTSGNVDYSLAITKDDDKKESSVRAIESFDTSPSTASTNQSLGIY